MNTLEYTRSMATTRWGGLRLEPYKPDAVDADMDGIVQEGTAWERPAATTLLDNLGRPIRTGITSQQRPAGMKVIDSTGKEVAYKPTYGEAPQVREKPGAGKQTPLADFGARSLQEMGLPTVKDMNGSVRDRVAPRAAKPLTPEQVEKGWMIVNNPSDKMLNDLPIEDKVEYGKLRTALNKILEKVDEPEERTILSAIILNSFYWGTVAFNVSGGSFGNFVNDIWYSAQDAGFSPHELLEDLWVAGGAFAVALPLIRLQEKFQISKNQTKDFLERVKERMRERQLKAGQFREAFKERLREVLKQLGRKNDDGPSFGRDFPDIAAMVEAPTEKPRYPRQPPAQAFSGKAEEIFAPATNWQEFKDILDKQEMVFLDYETTGLEMDEFGRVISNGQPTQIGAVKMLNGEIIDRFNVYINPGVPHSEWTQWSRENLRDADGNLITQDFLDNQPLSDDAHRQFVEWAGSDALLGMQNAIFDDEVLARSLRESGIDWSSAGYIDTKEIADMTLPKWSPATQDGPIKHDANGIPILGPDGSPASSNSLGDITRYLGVELGAKHHTADFDAEATAKVLQRIVDGGIERGWSTDVLDSTKRRAKEQANEENFRRGIEAFNQQVALWRAQQAPQAQ